MKNQGLTHNANANTIQEKTLVYVGSFDPIIKPDVSLLRILNHMTKEEGFRLVIVVVNDPMGSYLYRQALRISMVENIVFNYNNPSVSVVGYSGSFVSPSQIASRLGAQACAYSLDFAHDWQFFKKKFQILFSGFFFPKIQNLIFERKRKTKTTLTAVQQAIIGHDYPLVKRMVPSDVFPIIRTREGQILGI